jgi:DNA-binding NarL/FixJ family response regulator
VKKIASFDYPKIDLVNQVPVNQKIKIIVADDHCLFRQSIARALKTEPAFDVIGEAPNGEALLDHLNDNKADVILLDLEMPVIGSWKILDTIQQKFPSSKVIVVSPHFENVLIKQLMSKGAKGFLPKNTDFDILIRAIYDVSSGGYFISKEFSEGLLKDGVKLKVVPPADERGLSHKEKETLILICKDKLTKEIAEEMNVSERTIERYKSNIYEKTKAKTPAGLALYALKNKLISGEI